MKKNYIAPETKVTKVALQQMIATSVVIGDPLSDDIIPSAKDIPDFEEPDFDFEEWDVETGF